MKTVLVLCPFYLPGYKAGGPIRTIQGMVEILGSDIQFNIITCDRDIQDSTAFPGIRVNAWQKVGNSEVFYLSPFDAKNLIGIRKAILSKPYDILYINSFFDPRFAIIPIILHRMHLIPNTKVLLAPRGEFSIGAVSIKKWKKIAYLYLSKALNLYSKVFWHASSLYEKNDIIREFSLNKPFSNSIRHTNELDFLEIGSNILIASDLSINHKINTANKIVPYYPFPTYSHEVSSLKDGMKIIFLSRITNKKNLSFALNVLSKIKYNIIFDIYGPIDQDKSYWTECQNIISKLPGNVKTFYRGIVEPDLVKSVFSQYQLFFFPTKGENFGHVILESLLAGCPVLISDQTPWLELEKYNAGWALPLSKPEEFCKVINSFFQFSENEIISFRIATREYANKNINDVDIINQNRNLFEICP